MNSSAEERYLVVETFDEQDRLLKRMWMRPRTRSVHRLGGPAVQEFNPETGEVTKESWIDKRHGDQYRDGFASPLVPPHLQHDVEYLVDETFDEDGSLEKRVWMHPDSYMFHRENAPAIEFYDPESGQLSGEMWIDEYNHGRHRGDNLPSNISIDPQTGVVTMEQYYRHGRLHRDDYGPTQIYRDGITGKITELKFHFEGELHREDDLPAFQEFDSTTGAPLREEFFHRNEHHRINGPAIIEYDDKGQVIVSSLEFYEYGQRTYPNNKVEPEAP